MTAKPWAGTGRPSPKLRLPPLTACKDTKTCKKRALKAQVTGLQKENAIGSDLESMTAARDAF